MKGSLRALTREYLVGNQTEQILGWHFGNFEKCEGASPLLQLCQCVRRRCAELGEGFLQVSQAVKGNHQAPVCDVHIGATNSLDERSEVAAKSPLFTWIPIQFFHLPVQAENLLLGEERSR